MSSAGDPYVALRWTYDQVTIARVRELARRHGEEALALLAVLRNLAWHSDGGDGGSAFPGLRLIAAENVIGRARASRLRDLLIAEGLVIDTGARRGKGGTPVLVLACPRETGTAQSEASSQKFPDDASGPEVDSNWHRTGTAQGGSRPQTTDQGTTDQAVVPTHPLSDDDDSLSVCGAAAAAGRAPAHAREGERAAGLVDDEREDEERQGNEEKGTNVVAIRRRKPPTSRSSKPKPLGRLDLPGVHVSLLVDEIDGDGALADPAHEELRRRRLTLDEARSLGGRPPPAPHDARPTGAIVRQHVDELRGP
jgi:hypothetical protein